MKYYNVEETANRIRDLRIRNGYTQEKAAELLGIDRSYLSRIENGSKGCSVDLFIQMSERYRVSLDYLILGKRLNVELLRSTLVSIIKQLKAMLESL